MITLCGFAVSGYYNKLKLILLEKEIPFREKLVYPWERDSFRQSSPIGKIPFVETEYGALSESQVVLEYLEERYPERPMYPSDPFARAKCRELIQHLELNAEWVARRLYKESLFGGSVSEEAKNEAKERLPMGMAAVAQFSHFSPLYFRRLFYRCRLCRLHAFPLHQDYDAGDLRGKHSRSILPGLDRIHATDGLSPASAKSDGGT